MGVKVTFTEVLSPAGTTMGSEGAVARKWPASLPLIVISLSVIGAELVFVMTTLRELLVTDTGWSPKFTSCGATEGLAAVTVTSTVAGAPLLVGSLTINCATKLPATSATKLVFTAPVEVRVAVLPAGFATSDQE